MSTAPSPLPDPARRFERDRAPVRATPELAASLQAVLVDLIELTLQAKHAHWNVVGADFKAVHELLDLVVDTARRGADDIAERMLALETRRHRQGRRGTALHNKVKSPTGLAAASSSSRACVREPHGNPLGSPSLQSTLRSQPRPCLRQTCSNPSRVVAMSCRLNVSHA